MLDAGDPAPDFDLPRPTTDGSETYRLSAAAREGPVVLAFCPVADGTSAATLLRELASVDWASVTDTLAVFAVGVGERADHDRLAADVDVPFPLLLDRDGFFADRYGVLDSVGDDAVRVRRALFVVGEDCFVRFAWAGAEPDESPPLGAVRSVVAST